MLIHKRIKIGKKYVRALMMKLGKRNLIVLKGRNGYVMCGYLDLAMAQKFKDVAIKITGVSTIGQALGTSVSSCTASARKLGIYRGQSIKEVLKIIG